MEEGLSPTAVRLVEILRDRETDPRVSSQAERLQDWEDVSRDLEAALRVVSERMRHCVTNRRKRPSVEWLYSHHRRQLD